MVLIAYYLEAIYLDLGFELFNFIGELITCERSFEA